MAKRIFTLDERIEYYRDQVEFASRRLVALERQKTREIFKEMAKEIRLKQEEESSKGVKRKRLAR